MAENILTANDFKLVQRGPELFNTWRAKELATPIGNFRVELITSLKDAAPPDEMMLELINQLVAEVRITPGDIRERIFEHYSKYKEWLDFSGVPANLTRKGVLKHVSHFVISVHRHASLPWESGANKYNSWISMSPEWDEEHGLHLVLKDGQWVFYEF